MRTREFEALKAGQKIIVTGTQDGRHFISARGTIKSVGHMSLVTFHGFPTGHGKFNADWYLTKGNAPKLKITVERETTAVAPKPVEAPKLKKAPRGPQAYKGNGKHSWEDVTDSTVRLRVPGGWLYGKRLNGRTLSQTTFVPVPAVVGYSI